MAQLEQLLLEQKAYFAGCGGGGAAADGVPNGGVPRAVLPPPCPVLRVAELRLRHWFTGAKATRGSLVAALHTEASDGSGLRVVAWSSPTRVGGGGLAREVASFAFREGGARVSGDVRVSVFALKKLRRARRERAAAGVEARLPFDDASRGPWGEGEAAAAAAAAAAARRRGGGSSTRSSMPSDGRRTIAGKEPGCLFYFIFHTAFAGGGGGGGAAAESDGELVFRVPVGEMDKAFKDRSGRWRPEGTAELRYERELGATESV